MLTATRLAVNGRRYQFLSNLLNIIDIISILPFYASVIAASSDSDFDPTGLVGLRVLRFIRILRIFKFGRYNSGLRLLLATLHDSKAELAVLLIFLSIAVTLFGSLMFIIENAACDDYDQTTPTNADDCQEGFGSIPRSMWWAVITFTTVGYGDVYPLTYPGKIIGACTAIGSIIMLAGPISVMSSTFGDKYQEHSNRQARMDELARRDTALDSIKQMRAKAKGRPFGLVLEAILLSDDYAENEELSTKSYEKFLRDVFFSFEKFRGIMGAT